MIILSEDSSQLERSSSARDLHISTEAVKTLGCSVYYIPSDFSICVTAANALAHIPTLQPAQKAVWVGYIPSRDRYKAIYLAAQSKRIAIVNAPEEHARAMEFDHAYRTIALSLFSSEISLITRS